MKLTDGQKTDLLEQIKKIAVKAPELNMDNYDDREVSDLNNAMIEIYMLVKDI